MGLKIITNYEAVPEFFHEMKSKILKLLLTDRMNLTEISKTLNINPGTTRRYLDDLIRFDLVEIVSIEKSKFGQVMKYYRATGTSFKIEIEFVWP
jgi:predicted ArsR family transcriptional regulator